MEFDYSKLRGRIVEKYGSISAFSKAYGVHINVISRKLNNKISISPSDTVRFCKLLDIPICDIGEYFFTPKV